MEDAKTDGDTLKNFVEDADTEGGTGSYLQSNRKMLIQYSDMTL